MSLAGCFPSTALMTVFLARGMSLLFCSLPKLTWTPEITRTVTIASVDAPTPATGAGGGIEAAMAAAVATRSMDGA